MRVRKPKSEMEQLKNNSVIRGKVKFYSRYGEGTLKEHIFRQKPKISLIRKSN